MGSAAEGVAMEWREHLVMTPQASRMLGRIHTGRAIAEACGGRPLAYVVDEAHTWEDLDPALLAAIKKACEHVRIPGPDSVPLRRPRRSHGAAIEPPVES